MLVVVDQFTKWVECYALANQTAERLLEPWCPSLLGDWDALSSCTVIRVATLRAACSKKCVTH